MRTTFLISILCLSAIQLAAQQKPVFILGERVALFQQPDVHLQPTSFLDGTEELTATAVDDYWYQVFDKNQALGYVIVWDVLPKDEANGLTPKRITPSASTLFRMMKYFKRTGHDAKAIDFCVRIVNTHNGEEYPTPDNACFKLGHLAYMNLISNREEGVIYDDFLLTFTRKILMETEEPTVQALARFHLARYMALHGKPSNSLDQLLVIVEKYPTAFSRNECEPDNIDSWFFKPQRAKHLFFAVSMIQTNQALGPVKKRLAQIIESNPNPDSQAMAKELLDNMGSMPYEREQSIWY